MPCRWSATPLRGVADVVRCRRPFGYPGRIDTHERVWLTFEGWTGTAEITLNGRCLGSGLQGNAPHEYDVTAMLRERNELIVDLQGDSEEGGLWGEVAMEVRCLAWLRDVRVRLIADNGTGLAVDGIAAGTSERPLELYAILGRSTVLYALVQPRPEGAAFHFKSDPVTLDPERPHPTVRVELVNGAVPWYTVDTALTT
jgi:hypothetical protein